MGRARWSLEVMLCSGRCADTGWRGDDAGRLDRVFL